MVNLLDFISLMPTQQTMRNLNILYFIRPEVGWVSIASYFSNVLKLDNLASGEVFATRERSEFERFLDLSLICDNYFWFWIIQLLTSIIVIYEIAFFFIVIEILFPGPGGRLFGWLSWYADMGFLFRTFTKETQFLVLYGCILEHALQQAHRWKRNLDLGITYS